MATFLARSLRSIGARGIARLPTKWNVGPRYYASPSSGGKITNSFNLIVIGGTVVAGVMTYSYLHHKRNRSSLIGLSELHTKKSEDYQREGAIHPEAEAEALISTNTLSNDAQESTTTTSPVVEVDEVDDIPDIPGFAPYVLIGGGTASFAAAKAIREKDPTAKVLIIGEEDYTPYSRPPLSKQLWLYEDHEAAKQLKFKASWSGGKVVDIFYKANFCSPKDLPYKEEGGIAVVTGRKVTSLDPRKKKVLLDNGWELFYDKCLLATGGKPKTLAIFEKGLEGKVSTYRNVPDYKAMDSLLDNVKSILIVGGSFLGSELAVGLANRGKEKGVKITQIFPEGGILGLVLPKDLSKWTTEQVRNEGIHVIPETIITGASYDGDKVKVTTESGTELEADHVVLAVGLEPNTDLAKSARLEVDSEFGGYKVNAELQACTGVWAAGDVASFYDPYLGRRRVEHHDHANVSGKLAGYNMTGAHEPFLHQSMFWSDIGPNVGFEATGIIDSKLPTVGIWSRTSTELVDTPEDDYSKGVVYYLAKEQGRIVGVLTWNIFGKMDVARQIISEEKTEAHIGDLTVHFELNN